MYWEWGGLSPAVTHQRNPPRPVVSQPPGPGRQRWSSQSFLIEWRGAASPSPPPTATIISRPPAIHQCPPYIAGNWIKLIIEQSCSFADYINLSMHQITERQTRRWAQTSRNKIYFYALWHIGHAVHRSIRLGDFTLALCTARSTIISFWARSCEWIIQLLVVAAGERWSFPANLWWAAAGSGGTE